MVRFDFDLHTETVSNQVGCTGTIVNRKDGSFELILDCAPAAGDAGATFHYVYLADAAGNVMYLGDGSSGFYILHAQAVQCYDRGPLIPSLTGTVSSVAPIVFDTDADLLRILSDGSLQLTCCFKAHETGSDIPLWSAWQDGANYLDCLLEAVVNGGVQYRVKLGAATTGPTTKISAANVLEHELEVRVRAYTDETAHVVVIQDGTTVLIDEWLSRTGYTGLDFTRLYTGCLNNGTGQQLMTVRFERSEDG